MLARRYQNQLTSCDNVPARNPGQPHEAEQIVQRAWGPWLSCFDVCIGASLVCYCSFRLNAFFLGERPWKGKNCRLRVTAGSHPQDEVQREKTFVPDSAVEACWRGRNLIEILKMLPSQRDGERYMKCAWYFSFLPFWAKGSRRRGSPVASIHN